MDRLRVELLGPTIVRDRRREADRARLAEAAWRATPRERVLVARLGELLGRAGDRLEVAARPRPAAPRWAPVGDPCLECGG